MALRLGFALGTTQRDWRHSQFFILRFGLSDNSVHAGPENTRTSTRFQAAGSEIFFRRPYGEALRLWGGQADVARLGGEQPVAVAAAVGGPLIRTALMELSAGKGRNLGFQ